MLKFLLCAGIVTAANADVISLNPVADSSIFNDSLVETSNSRGQFLFAGLNGVGGPRRALIRFDVSSIPAGAQITGVELTLTVSRQGPNVTHAMISRCLSPWNEGPSEATGEEGTGAPAGIGDPSWTYSSFNTVRWNQAGGDMTNVPSFITGDINGAATVTFSGSGMMGNVETWRANASTNNGWIIQGDESVFGSATRFCSRENLDPATRPVLRITYTAACAADFNHDSVVDFFDYLDFVSAFAGNEPAADFNGDAVIDFFDYLDFVAAFASGC